MFSTLNLWEKSMEQTEQKVMYGLDLKQVVALVLAVLMFGAMFLTAVTDTSKNKHEYRMENATVEKAQIDLEKTKVLANVGALPTYARPAPTPAARVLAAPTHVGPVMHVAAGDRWVVASGAMFVFPSGGGGRIADIIVKDIPSSFDGEFMLVSKNDPSQRAWTSGWSSEPSPTDVTSLMREHQSWPSNQDVLSVHTSGQVSFKFN